MRALWRGFMTELTVKQEREAYWFDFTDSIPNPYTKKLEKQVTIRLDQDTIAYFKQMAEDKVIPYQSRINLYLGDCAKSNRDLKWQ